MSVADASRARPLRASLLAAAVEVLARQRAAVEDAVGEQADVVVARRARLGELALKRAEAPATEGERHVRRAHARTE